MFLTQRGICPSFCVRMILQILLYIFDGDPGVLLFFPPCCHFKGELTPVRCSCAHFESGGRHMLLLLLIFLSQRPGHFFRLPDLFSCIHGSLGVKRNYCAKVELGISDNKQGCIRNTGELSLLQSTC